MHRSCSDWMRVHGRPFLVVIFAATGFAVLFSGPADAAAPELLKVRLVIDYNDGVERHFTKIPWKKGITVLDIMNDAVRSPHGLAFESTGKGSFAFLTQIDDLKNQGGGTGKKNWILHVNNKLATQGFGIIKLQPKDVVRWRFETFKF